MPNYCLYRKRLFNMMNDLPTIFEVVNGTSSVKKDVKKEKSVSNNSGNKAKTNLKGVSYYCNILTVFLLICFWCWLLLASLFAIKKRDSGSQGKYTKSMQHKDEEESYDDEEDDEHGDTLCGACGDNYASDTDEFWICCDICEKWFHGKCVKITPARAEHIKQYKCPSCSNKRARPWCSMDAFSVVCFLNSRRCQLSSMSGFNFSFTYDFGHRRVWNSFLQFIILLSLHQLPFRPVRLNAPFPRPQVSSSYISMLFWL